MVKTDPSGNITTLLLAPTSQGGQSYNNTYLDAFSNVLNVYNWDTTTWTLNSITKYYPGGTVEDMQPQMGSSD